MPHRGHRHDAIRDALSDIAPLLATVKRDPEAVRQALVVALKPRLANAREHLQARFESGKSSGLGNAREHAKIIDGLCNVVWEAATRACGKPAVDGMVLGAAGGYGRGELSPYSDIDLLLIHTANRQAEAEEIGPFVLYALWDLGLKVGHAVRPIDDALNLAREDITIRTNVLDARRLAGDGKLFRTFVERYQREVMGGTAAEFIEAKLAERDARHVKNGDSRYFLEPNVKEGKGGLRDLHTLYWIAKYAYGVADVPELAKQGVIAQEEALTYTKAREFLLKTRAHLHYLATRPEERLTFDYQTALAERMGFKDGGTLRAGEKCMKTYFLMAKQVGNLTRTLCAVLDEQQRRRPAFSLAKYLAGRRKVDGFALEGNRLVVASLEELQADPVQILRLFRAAQKHTLEIHPRTLRMIAAHTALLSGDTVREPAAGRLFMELLTGPSAAITLRLMNETGVLGRLIPDFGRIVGQMQYDMYHVFTVDEHTLNAVHILQEIEKGTLAEELPVATKVIKQVQQREVLYLAMFMHDIAKGRGGDHSVVGERLARKMAQRLGFNVHDAETVAWLVRQHLLMSMTAFKRDLDDPATIREFISKVRTPERLRLLLVLTATDIRAVGPNIWNGWKGALLRKLYASAEMALTGGDYLEAITSRLASLRLEVRHVLETAHPGTQEAERYVAQATDAFLLCFDAQGHMRVHKMLADRQRAGAALHLETHVDSFHAVTEVTIVTPDQPGLFAKLAGVMALNGANIVNARVFTLKNGMAVDMFWIQDATGQAFSRGDKLAKLAVQLEMAVSGTLDIEAQLAKQHGGVFNRAKGAIPLETVVTVDAQTNPEHTLVEITAPDQPGFLYRAARSLSELGCNITNAHISTLGGMIVDVFYLTDCRGKKLRQRQELAALRVGLHKALVAGSGKKAA